MSVMEARAREAILRIEFVLHSGHVEEVTTTPDPDVTVEAAAEHVAKSLATLKWMCGQDASSGDWFFVRMVDVSFVRVKAES